MRLTGLALFAALSLAAPASGEIEKLVTQEEQGLRFHWWPKLPPLEGWQHDREHSLVHGVNALAPIGSSFAEAETVMYAKALYKPRIPETSSLDALIESDKRDFRESSPGVEIAEAPALTTADGKRLRSLTFFPAGAKGNWERVAYGEEGDFYLVFTISSRSRKGYEASLGAYERLLARYRERP